MFKNYIANIILKLLPPTRFFVLKRTLLNLLGFCIGKNARICGDVRFYGRGGITIGDNTWIGIGCTFYVTQAAAIVIGSNCDIAPEVSFHTGSHEPGDHIRRAGAGVSKPIYIGDGSWIGTRTTILGGANIGRISIVGACSMVSEDKYPESSLLVGIPAVIKKKLK